MKVMVLIGLMLSLAIGVAPAASQTFGRWFTDTKKDDFLYAISVNDSGAVFGEFCYPGLGSCVWLIAFKTRCRDGSKYPVLANSDAGATHVEVLCDGQLDNGLFRYVFTDYDRIDSIIRQGARVGFAVPLQEDEFRVVRFDLDGAVTAIRTMRAAAERRMQPVKRDTRDKKL